MVSFPGSRPCAATRRPHRATRPQQWSCLNSRKVWWPSRLSRVRAICSPVRASRIFAGPTSATPVRRRSSGDCVIHAIWPPPPAAQSACLRETVASAPVRSQVWTAPPAPMCSRFPSWLKARPQRSAVVIVRSCLADGQRQTRTSSPTWAASRLESSDQVGDHGHRRCQPGGRPRRPSRVSTTTRPPSRLWRCGQVATIGAESDRCVPLLVRCPEEVPSLTEKALNGPET